MKPVIAIVLAALIGTSCQALQSDPFQSPSVEAEFRWHAREMYASLRMPSCEAPPGFDRKAKLENEYKAVRSFERQTHATPAQIHIEIASADAAFEQAKDEGCWMEYSGLAWAEKHVEMTKESVRGTLDQLRDIAPSLHQSALSDVTGSSNAPEFRYLVRQLVQFARPQCQLTTTAGNEQVMGPAQAEIARFRKGLEGTPFADNFDVAEADVAYEISITMVECTAPGRAELAQASRDAVVSVRRELAAIGRLVQNRQT